MRRIIISAVIAAAALGGIQSASADPMCQVSVQCVLDQLPGGVLLDVCSGGVSYCPNADACYGTVNVCGNADTCQGGVNVCDSASYCWGVVNLCR
jgi:hypothetical protein